MCLSVAVDRPDCVLLTGKHAGHEFAIVRNGIGYRCGYVKVEPGHPWHSKDYEDVRAEVHGGLNFAAADKPCDKGGADNGWWLGFDCAHGGDAPDPSLPMGLPKSGAALLGKHGEVRTTEYVEIQCKRLCEQAASAA